MSEWDEKKRLSNFAAHGVDFRRLDALHWDDAVIFADLRKDYGEKRMIAMVKLGRRLHVIVFVERKGQRRFISARKANSREIAYYEEQTRPSQR